jgi:EAL domain-containing protein (putative c-di-GMP-specific phosphodiesterase class I)
VVKLDRTLILQAMSNPMARRILPKVIDIIHELGAVVVCEGIETEDQFKLARESGADLLQGFLLAVPSEHLTPINLDTGP